MTDPFDPVVSDWLADGPEQGPREPLARTLAATRRMSQRPAWLAPTPTFAAGSTLSLLSVNRRVVVLAALAVLALALLLGTLLVASRPRVPHPFGPAANGAIAFQSSGRINVADADGSHVRPLTAGSGIESGPAFSPDGASIAFWSGPSAVGSHDLVVAAADGSGSRSLNDGHNLVPRDAAVPPSWSPDERSLVVAATVDGVPGLYVVGVDGSGMRQLIETLEDETLADPAWSPTGEWIAYVHRTPQADALAALRPDGRDDRTLAAYPASESSTRVFQGFAWSPDGARIAYQFLGSGGGEVSIVDLGGGIAPVADDPPSEFNPAWSPDGRWLAFMADDGQAVDIARPDGSDRRTVARGLFEGSGCPVMWSPDRTTILGSKKGFDCGPTRAGRILAVRIDDVGSTFEIDAVADGLASWQRSPP